MVKKKKYFYEKQEYWLFLEVSDWESRKDASEGMKVYSQGPECSMPLTWGVVSCASDLCTLLSVCCMHYNFSVLR